MNMSSLSHFDDPDDPDSPDLTARPDVRLSGQLGDFQPGTLVRLRITVMQAKTDAIAKVDKIVRAPAFEVTADELFTGRVKDSPEFDESCVVATAQAIVQWGKELRLR